jgi:hypothetical protein
MKKVSGRLENGPDNQNPSHKCAADTRSGV